MADEYVLRSSVLKAIHNGDIDMGIVTTHEYYLLKKLSKKIDRRIQRVPAADVVTWEELQKTWKIANHDVRPVRHGRWIDTDNYYMRWKCSECGNHTRDARPPYCPNCGADMREVSRE